MEKSEARVVAKANKPVNPFTWKSDYKDINKRDHYDGPETTEHSDLYAEELADTHSVLT